MSIQVKFYVLDKEYNVLEYETSIQKSVDDNNRPWGRGFFKGLEMLIEASKDTFFFEEALKSFNLLQCRLERTPVTMNGKTNTLYFIDAIVVKSTTIYKANGTTPFAEKVHIVAGGLRDSNSHEEYSEAWRINYPIADTEKEQEEDNDPRIIRQYITDTQDNVLEEYQQGEHIYYVIESENMIGEDVNIKIKDKGNDFTYKGQRLTNDTITNYIIEGNTEKIPLEVVSENDNS